MLLHEQRKRCVVVAEELVQQLGIRARGVLPYDDVDPTQHTVQMGWHRVSLHAMSRHTLLLPRGASARPCFFASTPKTLYPKAHRRGRRAETLRTALLGFSTRR